MSKNLQYSKIDSSGNLLAFQRLNNFPVTDTDPALKETVENSFMGWIEDRVDKKVAILGLLERKESTIYFSAKEISSLDHHSTSISLSEGAGVYAVWSEEIYRRVISNHLLEEEKILVMDMTMTVTALSMKGVIKLVTIRRNGAQT